MRCLLPLLCLLSGLHAAVEVRVFYDTDGDGHSGDRELGAPQVLVSDGDRIQSTDADGRLRLEPRLLGDEPRRVFVIVPSGHRATTAWHLLIDPTADQTLEVGLRPVTEPDELRFAVTSDTQVTEADAERVGRQLLEDVTPGEPPPAFITVLGDLTEHGTAAELRAWREAVAASPVPVMNVFGAHDGLRPDGVGIGEFVRAIGPAWYAFWSGGRCFIVMATEPEVLTGVQQARQLRWYRRLLGLLPTGAELVLLGHVPPAPAELDRARDRHALAAVLYGHWHENAVWFDQSTPCLATGPYRGNEWGAGTGSFRRVTIGRDGIRAPVIPSGVREQLEILAPSPLQPADRLQLPLRVAAFDSRSPITAVTASLAGGPAVPLTQAAPRTWRLDLPPTAGGSLQIAARLAMGESLRRTVELPAPAESSATVLGDAPLRPPLTRAWLTSTGTPRLVSGGLVADGDRLYVSIPDPGLPSRPAIACYDAATGQQLWRAPTVGSVYREVASGGGRVFALTSFNQVQAFDAGTGRELWRVDLAAGRRARHQVAQTGVALWRDRLLAQVGGGPLTILDPITGQLLGRVGVEQAYYQAPAATAQQLVIPTLTGLLGLDPLTGDVRWRRSLDLPRHGPITIADNLGVILGPELVAVDLTTGLPRWRRALASIGLNLGGVTVAGDAVYTPGGRPAAFRLATGTPLWGEPATPQVALSAPVVTDELVWSAGDDGSVAAWDRVTGEPRGRAQLGLPLKAGPVRIGGTLFVLDLDGNLHALTGRSGG